MLAGQLALVAIFLHLCYVSVHGAPNGRAWFFGVRLCPLLVRCKLLAWLSKPSAIATTLGSLCPASHLPMLA
jgi:hypothetical protein